MMMKRLLSARMLRAAVGIILVAAVAGDVCGMCLLRRMSTSCLRGPFGCPSGPASVALLTRACSQPQAPRRAECALVQ